MVAAAFAVTNLGLERKLLERHPCGWRAEIEEEADALVREREVALKSMKQLRSLAAVAQHDTTDQAAIADDQLFVGAAAGLGKLDGFVGGRGRLSHTH